jgi:hypothetical protein
MAGKAQSLPNCLNVPNSQKVLEIRSITLFRSLSAVALAKADAFYKAPVYCQLAAGNWQLYSTTVESSLQINPFCSNKPNFRKSQMNVSPVITREYVNWTLGQPGKNKPNSNPIQTQFKANLTQNKPNTNPKQTQFQKGI